MDWLDALTARTKLKTGYLIYSILFLIAGAIIGWLGVATLDNYKMHAIGQIAQSSEGGVLSLWELFILSESFQWLMDLIIPVSIILSLWFAFNLFYRHKIKPALQVMHSEDMVSYTNEDELANVAHEIFQIRQQSSLEQSQYILQLDQLDQHISGLLHEVRNPLTTLKGDLEILKGQVSETTVRLIVERMSRSQERIEVFLNRLARKESIHYVQANLQPIGLTELALSLEEHLKPLNPLIKFEYEVSEGWVEMDWDLFLEALDNILSNSYRFAKEQILIRLSRLENRVVLSICDDGTGFSEEALHKATECFYTESQGLNHLGYGLYFVKLLLTQQNIELKLRN